MAHIPGFKRLCALFFSPHTAMAVLLLYLTAAKHISLLAGLALLAVLAGLFFTSLHFFRKTFLDSAARISKIQERYLLVIPQELSGDFTSMLHFILDSVDLILDKEYSSRLLRKQAELDRMKSQINPHFLYNTLDSIRGYALMEHAQTTADMIEILSRIFRYTISQKNELIPLEQELNMLSDYISIQEYRLNHHILFLQIIQGNDSHLYSCPIPKLIFQPFIENSIKHGMIDTQDCLTITFRASATQSRLIFSIVDNGKGISVEKLAELNESFQRNEYDQSGSGIQSQKGSGIAIANVNARIKLLYGPEYGVTAYGSPGMGCEFQITLPLKEGLL